jgi:hypothetical protein
VTRNARQARQRRHEAARARQAARRRRDRRRLGLAAALAVLLVVGIGGLAVSVAGRSGQAATGTGALPGLQTGRRPGRRHRRPGRPPAHHRPAPLAPCQRHRRAHHQHLDLYIDGRKVPVPAGIGINPAVGFAPLHTHDASGVIHVESPTVRTYKLGQFFAVWGCGSPRAALAATAPPATGGCGSMSTAPPTRATPPRCPGSHEELVVAFGTASNLPSPIPSTYRFPSGP